MEKLALCSYSVLQITAAFPQVTMCFPLFLQFLFYQSEGLFFLSYVAQVTYLLF